MQETYLTDINNIKNIIHGKGPILVVDDDTSESTIVEHCYQLSKKNNPIIFIKTGFELLFYLEQVLREEKTMPEVIFLDINLTNENGLDVLKTIRQKEEFIKIPPIFVLSNSSKESDILSAKDLKANGYITKPNNIHSYIQFFREI